MTHAAEDRCWNCGMVPKRWFDVIPAEGSTSSGFSARTALREPLGRASTTSGLGRRRRRTMMTRTRSLYSFGAGG